MDGRLDPRCTTGGICKLRELIEEHPAELAYDFRQRFGISFEEIGKSVSWLEAIYLVAILMKDTGSWLQASVAGWKQPVSAEWIVGAHTFDLLAAANSKRKPKPYPTPWSDQGKQIGSRTKQSRAHVIAALARMNPKEPNA